EGVYISHTIESILVNNDGKQLLCEIFYLYGVMLLLLDYKIGGKVREHLIVSYIRYKGAGEQHTVEITSMCRATGYVLDKPLPESYPVQYFNRVPVDKEMIGMLIGRIRSDDIYQMSYNYPAPEHRSTALSIQAQSLYILLFFRPEILREERPVMREIVDKHFADNWVINYYMGFTVDLVVAWGSFKAASAAIQGTIAVENVAYYQKRMRASVKTLNKEIAGYLREGVLTEQYVLDNIHSLMLPKIREANVVLRWFMLHMTRGPALRRVAEPFKKSYEVVETDINADEILTLLLQTAQLEFSLKAMFVQFLKEKPAKWEKAKQLGSTKMQKLSTYFSGDDVLSDNVRVAQLESWFSDISERITSLEYNDSTSASRKIQKLMKALENVQEFHQIDSNLQVVQFIQDTRQLLRQMIRYINIEYKVLITIGTVGDLSYAWELMSSFGCFVPEIQNKIKRNPHLAIQMRSAFVKLASMLELPCSRIDQAAQNGD
ncbi:strumpellin-like protein, putative, partial [Bodo saltans]